MDGLGLSAGRECGLATDVTTTEIEAEVSARAWQTLFITSISVFLVAMDVTIVSVALPGITQSFREPASTLSWVFTAYNITFAALLLLAGKVGDRIGRKPAFLGGLLAFALASLLAGVAPSVAVLIGARVLQALGSALIYPASLALLLPEFPISKRSLAIGIWGGIAGLGGAVAPTLGALLVEWLNWRAVFFINIPFVVVAVAAGIRVLRDSKGENASQPFDAVAVPMASAAVGFLVLGVVQGQSWGWGSAKTVACFVVAALLFPLFVWRSSSHPAPLLDLDLFRIRSFAVANLCQALYVSGCFGWLVLMPSFFVHVWKWSPLKAGFGLAPAAAVGAVLSPFAGRAADRIGHRGLVMVGSLLGGLGGIWWIVTVDASPNYVRDILPGMLLQGFGIMAGFATLTGAIMSRVPPKFYSMGGAARSTIFQLATAIGIAVAVAVQASSSTTTNLVAPFRRVWTIAAVCAGAAALIMAAAFPRRVAPAAPST